MTVIASGSTVDILAGTTSLLLLAVFAVVNVAVLVLRRDVREAGGHFKTPTFLPVIGFIASAYLVLPFSGRPAAQYLVAGILVAVGVVLFFVTKLINKRLGIETTRISDPTHLGDAPH